MAFLASHPVSLRLRSIIPAADAPTQSYMAVVHHGVDALSAHSSHPDFGHLVLLVLEAVLEVVCVSLPGYIVARQGMFDANAQKFVANLNVQLFTPCLVFTKLASQLTADRLVDLAIIPIIFTIQTLVSWACASAISKACRFPKKEANFVTAMGVFGNSNSLPISLVISLSKTLRGLHWDQIPGDNDNEVAARGILYLLIFQQLGQLLRWSWGFNVLLKPQEETEQEEAEDAIERGGYKDNPDDEERRGHKYTTSYHSDYASGSSGPHSPNSVSSAGSTADLTAHHRISPTSEDVVTPANANIVHEGSGNFARRGMERSRSVNHLSRFPSFRDFSEQNQHGNEGGKRTFLQNIGAYFVAFWHSITWAISTTSSNLFHKLPSSLQSFMRMVGSCIFRFFNAIYQSMNPPLWAMLAAVIVASVPQLQALFFEKGTFINNSVTHAISQSGGVAVPLILVVLGANLARNTIPSDELAASPDEKRKETKLLYAALIARMLLPTMIMAPFLALFARYVPVSILDDPIFIIVCFLLTGAPSALQLAQICQLNGVFMGVMSRLLFQSYVIWILPSTLILVMLALETVEWAAAA